MKKDGNYSFGWYMFALFGGLTSGLLFSRAQYHKGQADAYDHISKDLDALSKGIEEGIHELEEKQRAES